MNAKDLLYTYFEYQNIWAHEDRAYEYPSKVRREQLEALQSAFGLTKEHVSLWHRIKLFTQGKKRELSRARHLNRLTNLEYLGQGEFLHDRPYEENNEVLEMAGNKIKELYYDLPEEMLNRRISIGWMFNDLMQFRQKVHNAMYPHEEMLDGFYVGLKYSQYLQTELKKVILDNLDPIDDVLWLILDPQKRDIPLEDLIANHNYPDVDLEKVDLEWKTRDGKLL